MCGWSHVDEMCSWVSRDEQQCMMGECLDLCGHMETVTHHESLEQAVHTSDRPLFPDYKVGIDSTISKILFVVQKL